MAEALRFVSEKLLRPIGVDLSPGDMESAAEIEQESLPRLKTALFQFISWVLFANKAEARNWLRRATINDAIDALRVIGYDPFMLNLDENPQHILLSICWLIWRTDLFKTVYEKYIPEEDAKYLPPYDEYLTDSEVSEVCPPREPSDDPDALTKRIQRLFSKVTMELNELSDIEMQRETFNWKIRAIDPETSFYALSLKANIPLLTEHTEALRRAVRNAPAVEKIMQIEQIFWEWISSIANRPTFTDDYIDTSRSTPIDWFPELNGAPYEKSNRCSYELSELLNKVKGKLGNAKYAFGDLSRDRVLGGGYSYDIIRREIDKKMDLLLRYEKINKRVSHEKKESNLIPDMPFKDYSDTELSRIINQSQDICDEVANSACPKIKEITSEMIEDTGLEMHGWEIEKFVRRRVEDDLDDYVPAEKIRLRAPKQTKATRQKVARHSLANDSSSRESEYRLGSGISTHSKPRLSASSSSSKRSSASSSVSGVGVAKKKKKTVARRPRPEWNP